MTLTKSDLDKVGSLINRKLNDNEEKFDPSYRIPFPRNYLASP